MLPGAGNPVGVCAKWKLLLRPVGRAYLMHAVCLEDDAIMGTALGETQELRRLR